jgi:hypothetical protein
VFAFLPVLGVAPLALRWVLLGLFLLQRLPPLLLTALIIFFPKPPEPEAMGTVTEAYVAAEVCSLFAIGRCSHSVLARVRPAAPR